MKREDSSHILEPGRPKPRVMLNPSCQYGNQIFDGAGTELYNEGRAMWLFAQAVKRELDSDGRVEVFISRQTQDGESDLDSEAALANSLNCDCLIALHSDATPDGTPGGGTWTFYTGPAHLSAEEQAALEYPLERSFRLAELVQGCTLQAIRSMYPEVENRGVREHWNRLRMLHAPKCPSCLIEILFHTNPAERELLKDSGFQALVGKAIAGAILTFLFEQAGREP